MKNTNTANNTKLTTKSKSIKKGKLIIIEGADGSGKATQAELLVDYLRKQKIRVRYYDFPQYEKNFFGDMVARFLRGEFGTHKQVSPYLVSLPFALDRAMVAFEMKSWLAKGGWIICNRYVSSHLAHQSAKIADLKSRNEFIRWIQQLEHEVLGIPCEDLVLYLQVPSAIASKLTLKKGSRKHLGSIKKDIAESDVRHQLDAGHMYVVLARRFKHWRLIKCINSKGELLPIASIHEKVVQSLQNYG